MKYTFEKLEHAKIADEAMDLIKPITDKRVNAESLSANYNGDVFITISWYNESLNLSFLSELSSPYTKGGNKIAMSCTQANTSICFFKCLPSGKSLTIIVPTRGTDTNSILL